MSGLVLLTGATGYVGGRLLPALEAAGHRVRCISRHPASLAGKIGPRTEVVPGDVRDEAAVRAAMSGVETAYYLVHAMSEGLQFQQRDRQSAEVFAGQARAAGVKRIIYLGGLGQGPALSAHLASRQEVGRILRTLGPPGIEFRASIILGSGSLSFEMIRALVDRLPMMVTPRWVHRLAQPIAIEDVIAYLIAGLEVPPQVAGVFEIGGPNRASYLDIMKEYARQRGLRRVMIPVPVLTPRLSGLWLQLVTPMYARVGRQLIDSIRHDTVVIDQKSEEVFAVRPRNLSEAIARAIRNEDEEFARTRWSDALSSSEPRTAWGGTRFGSRLVDSRVAATRATPADAFAPIQRIGGERGWYFASWLWTVRGFLDAMIGGVGRRRGRRHAVELAEGDTLDFWRVEALEPGRLLRLRAEMRLPGRAWLQFEVDPDGRGGAVLRQTALFDPAGLLGLAYWYALYPLHQVVFAGMLRGIVRSAEQDPQAGSATGGG